MHYSVQMNISLLCNHKTLVVACVVNICSLLIIIFKGQARVTVITVQHSGGGKSINFWRGFSFKLRILPTNWSMKP